MARHRSRHGRKSHRRSRRGGANNLLGYGSYPASVGSGGNWATAVSGSPTAVAASQFKPFLSNFSAGSPQQNSAALNNFAMTGPGQSGGSRRRRGRKAHSSRRRHRGGAMSGLPPTVGMPHLNKSDGSSAQPAQTGSQSGGMFASFGSLLKEALVPLGLLAVQQTYGRKRRGSKHYTRKYRK